MSNWNISATSDKGRIRTNNEDMILVSTRFVRDNSLHINVEMDNNDRFIAAVADGMGGHNGGEVASEEVLKSLCDSFHKLSPGLNISELNELIYSWLETVNQKLTTMGIEDETLIGLGTTLVGLIRYENYVFWMNCGDSRFYRFRNGILTQVSSDHSLNNLTGENRHSNVIVNCIGGGCRTSYIDLVEFSDDVNKGDVFILCSDGLNDMLSDVEIERVLAAGGAAEELCAAAVTAGGYDNVSVCVLKVN